MSYGRYRDDQPDHSFEPRGGGEALVGRVKWFDPGKGFGFVQVDGIAKDPFLHANTLGQFGYREVAEGATIRFHPIQTPKGMSVGSIESIDESTAAPLGDRGRERRPPRDNGGHRREPDAVESSLEATLKWFNHEKGFGFFSNPGGDDLFVHVTALRASGLDDVREGDRFLVHVGMNRGRRCVVRLEPI